MISSLCSARSLIIITIKQEEKLREFSLDSQNIKELEMKEMGSEEEKEDRIYLRCLKTILNLNGKHCELRFQLPSCCLAPGTLRVFEACFS